MVGSYTAQAPTRGPLLLAAVTAAGPEWTNHAHHAHQGLGTKHMRKRWPIGIAGLAALAAVGALLGSGKLGLGVMGKADAAKAAGAAASAPLDFRANEVLRPQRSAMPQTIEFSGPLVAPGTAVLRAKAAGTLLSLSVAEGARVTAGQLLGRIDMADLGNRIAERHANVDSARAALAQAERSHGGNERLAAQAFISPMALDSSRANVDAARAALQAAQATLELTRGARRDASLVAPISGIVAKRHVLPGEKVSMEQQVLTLVDLRTLELAALVGTHEVARLTPGMAASLRVEGLPEPVPATIARIAPAAEPGTRSIGVTLSLANPKEALRAGLYALGQVVLADEQQRMVLPVAAVGSTAGQNHVWLIKDGKLLRRAVTLGRRDDAAGRVEVLSGLDPADTVLAARFDNLREGALARVLEAAAPGPAAASPQLAASAPAPAPAPAPASASAPAASSAALTR